MKFMETNESLWKLETFRITSFVKEYSINPNLFEIIFHKKSDNSNIDRNLGIYQDISNFDSFDILLYQENERIDLHILPKANLHLDKLDEFICIDDLINVENDIKEIYSSFLNNTSNFIEGKITRLAMGSSVLSLDSSKERAYKKLSDFVKILRVDSKKDSEVILNINRVYDLESFNINCISKWSVIRKVIRNIENNTLIDIPNKFAIKLEVDINTEIKTQLSDIKNYDSHKIFDSFFEKFKLLCNEGID